MKIILNEDIHKLGLAGDVVEVADGYARNFLFPKNKAIILNKGNEKRINHIKELHLKFRAEKEKSLVSLITELENKEIYFPKKADEKGHLYGSVSGTDILSELLKLSNNSDLLKKDMIFLDNPIKELGEFKVQLKLSKKISTEVKVIVKEES